MKILYIHQYFKTPEEGGAIRSYYLSTALARAGHEVHLITASNTHSGKKMIDGVNVYYLPISYDNHFGFGKRIWAFFKFISRAYLQALNVGKVDICYATSTPLSVGILALMLKKIQRIPYYFEVRDLWPDVPIEMKVVKKRLLIHLLLRLEKSVYDNADKIIALSPGMAQGVRAKSQKEVFLIPNIADCAFFQPPIKEPENPKISIIYMGSIGKSNNLLTLIELAKFCKAMGIEDAEFLIAGDGAEKDLILSKIEDNHLSNVTYLGSLSKAGVKDILEKCTAVYISFADYPILGTCSPNKFFDGIAAGKIIITNYHGWVTNLIIEHNAGFFLDRNHPEKFATDILPVLKNKSLMETMQKNSYTLAQSIFDRPLLEKKFLELFQKC